MADEKDLYVELEDKEAQDGPKKQGKYASVSQDETADPGQGGGGDVGGDVGGGGLSDGGGSTGDAGGASKYGGSGN